ncbi:MAG TPA: DUF4132 domain-containing protein [Actinomycetes bacterium]|nr:DUF4132 domain-containing protein [Actinomycetes bacterium]
MSGETRGHYHGLLSVPPDLRALRDEQLPWVGKLVVAASRPDDNAGVAVQELLDRVSTSTDQIRRASVMAVLTVISPPEKQWLAPFYSPIAGLLGQLSRRRFDWTPEQTSWLLTFAAPTDSFTGATYPIMSLAVRAAQNLQKRDPAGFEWLRPQLQELAESLGNRDWLNDQPGWPGLIRRVITLASNDDSLTLSDGALLPLESFGTKARTELFSAVGEPATARLFLLLTRYAGGVTASDKWLKDAADLTASDPPTLTGARFLVSLMISQPDPEAVEWRRQFVSEPVANLIRAAVWFVTSTPDADTVRTLRDAAAHCSSPMHGSGSLPRCSQVATSAIAALPFTLLKAREWTMPSSTMPSRAEVEDVVAALSTIRAAARTKKLMRDLDAALGRVSDITGITSAELLERAVPTFGFGSDQVLKLPVGDHIAVCRISIGDQTARLETRWYDSSDTGGAGKRSVPAAVRTAHPEVVAELRTLAADVKKALVSQRARLEDLLVRERVWTSDDVVAHYFQHPIVGAHARQLIWQVASKPQQGNQTSTSRSSDARETPRDLTGQHKMSEWLSGFPMLHDGSWSLRLSDGSHRTIRPEDALRLWHPLLEPARVTRLWRDCLIAEQITQPFKQVFREVYLVTPAEELTRVYSNRFAAHILRYRQAGALMRTRGWDADHLGGWEGGELGQAVRLLPNGLRVRFYYEAVESAADEMGTPSLCATDQVRFERVNQRRWEPVPLSEIPKLVFSEAMRDVDLFVGVTSIANDPGWVDRGDVPHRNYWHDASFGELTESAEIRRDALARLLPRTTLRDCAEISGNFLVVRGQLREYRIHLGSTNILMSPNDSYLCIVPKRADVTNAADQHLWLPFEADSKLAVILSKAFMLAADVSITDPTIIDQIRSGLE